MVAEVIQCGVVFVLVVSMARCLSNAACWLRSFPISVTSYTYSPSVVSGSILRTKKRAVSHPAGVKECTVRTRWRRQTEPRVTQGVQTEVHTGMDVNRP